jgi:hypothetical protein
VSLKELESWLEKGQNVPFLREICPPKKSTPNIGADIGAITGILLTSLIFFNIARKRRMSSCPSVCDTTAAAKTSHAGPSLFESLTVFVGIFCAIKKIKKAKINEIF